MILIFFLVDNIPIKQLEENTLWLKDQIQALEVSGVQRSDIAELKPFVDGGNNVVKVNTGRFSARINDAYGLTALQKLQMLTGSSLGTFETYGSTNSNLLQATINALRSTLAASALNMNGLVERVLNWPTINEDFPAATTFTNGQPRVDSLFPPYTQYPIINTANFFQNLIQAAGQAYDLPKLSSEFIKQFRGVTRTAIVDVSEQLQISVPNWDDNDFFTLNSNNQKVPISGAQVRIDLLFIYSKSIDVNSTTIQKWNNGNPTVLTKPILGLIRGAGCGIKLDTGSFPSVVNPVLDSNGNTQIIPSVADANSTTNGFLGLNIHGSFPSPDDLMNLAPVISEKLQSTDAQLIGQSILPIAYIVIKKTANINTVGNIVLTDPDIIDIRPFFRTTELTYNERAGIAAASPQLSLENPAITQWQLDRESNRLIAKINEITGDTTVFPRVVGGGYLWGGISFGPEGAINDVLTRNGITQNLFSLGTTPIYPDWDLADWWDFNLSNASNGGANKGTSRNDRINFYHKARNQQLDGGFTIPAGLLGVWDDYHSNTSTGDWQVAWVKKKITINKNATPWLTDYAVRVNLENCVGMSEFMDSSFSVTTGGSQGIYVERQNDYFVIYIFWTCVFPYTADFLPEYNRDSNRFNQWAVRSSLFPNPSTPSANGFFPLLGSCTYPSASFEIVGYPQGFFNSTLPQAPNTPLITFR